MKVCLFGGSFDPPHKKHVEIAEELLQRFDSVWVIVAASSPFKNSHFTSFETRLEMTKLAFNNPRIKVLDIEQKMQLKYTYDTVRYLKDLYDYEFFFAIGSDNLDNLPKWYKYEELKDMVEFVVFERTSVSSTMSRITKNSGIDVIDAYIKEYGLYENKFQDDIERVRNNVSNKRFIHTVGVYNTITKIAQAQNLDVDKCQLAAIYHDYCKEYSEDELDIFIAHYQAYKDVPRSVLHGIIASHMLELDREVLRAIRYHTVYDKNPSRLTKALYIADYCEPNRNNLEKCIEILQMSYRDLDQAFEMCSNIRCGLVEKSETERIVEIIDDENLW